MSRRRDMHRQQRMAVGRIDFLGCNGLAGESLEYTNRKSFKETVKSNDDCGAPIHAYIYRGISGQPKCRIKTGDFNPISTKVEVIENPYIDYLRQYYKEHES